MSNMDNIRNEMIQKKKWAVIGFTPDKSKFGYKIYKRLKDKGYTVYGINPKYDEIEGEKVYKSISELPEKVECVNMIVNPKLSLNALDEIKDADIKYVWFQPGTFDEEVLNKAKKHGFEIVYHDCLYVELGRI